MVATASACSGSATARQATISKRVNGSMLSVSVHPQVHAGAIDSLVYRGVQYVDNHDHGRQIQSALQVDNLGECFNPTEAGSRANGAAQSTSSVVQKVSSAGNVLTTQTRAAFWLTPRQAYGTRCSRFRRETSAQNTTVLSNYLIERTTRFYGAAIPNMLSINISMTFPEQRGSASIEGLTGYLPKNFDRFYAYDVRAKRLSPLKAGPGGGQTLSPVVIATGDGQHAMGVISPGIPGAQGDHAYYAYFYFKDGGATAKWSCVFGRYGIRAGATLHFSCPIAVGTLREVTSALSTYAAMMRN